MGPLDKFRPTGYYHQRSLGKFGTTIQRSIRDGISEQGRVLSIMLVSAHMDVSSQWRLA